MLGQLEYEGRKQHVPAENTAAAAAAAAELGREQENGDGGGGTRAWMQD